MVLFAFGHQPFGFGAKPRATTDRIHKAVREPVSLRSVWQSESDPEITRHVYRPSTLRTQKGS